MYKNGMKTLLSISAKERIIGSVLLPMKTIPLTRGYEAIVDDEDLKLVSDFKWHVRLCQNIPMAISNTGINMSTLFMFPPIGKHVDHINHNTLDNRRCNLRICSPSQNCMNKKKRKDSQWKYKGLTKGKNDSKWMASIHENGNHHYLGRFKTQEDAAMAYNVAALKYHGEFAVLNDLSGIANN